MIEQMYQGVFYTLSGDEGKPSTGGIYNSTVYKAMMQYAVPHPNSIMEMMTLWSVMAGSYSSKTKKAFKPTMKAIKRAFDAVDSAKDRKKQKEHGTFSTKPPKT